MRRLIASLTALFACLLGLPGTAAAAPVPIGGGSVLFNPLGPADARCTVAFAATDGGREYLIAGDGCGTTTSTLLYSGDNVLVGSIVGGLDGGYVVVAVRNTDAWDVVGWIDAGGRHPIAGSKETPVGGRVCLLSHSSGITCGMVTAKNVTISYPEGTISGLTRTNICPQPRSVAYVTDDQAQGVPFGGGSGICTTAGTSYFFPVNRILAVYGLTLVTG
ncbi:S1 family peptidase [Actinophytocola sp. NPDC049390]|uniref:S1 family peptidase n=1 Tax=Actinophytocola sp. NPDC049390 TaxID=3363894 RepID=UPI00378F7C1F